jgi:transposase
MVRVIDGFIGGLDLARLGFVRARPAGIGRPGYRPGDLLRLHVYGYMNGVRSSRALERECWRNLELAWLLRRLAPDFKTIADFRKRDGEAIRAACTALVRFCILHELVRPRVVALDGSQFHAASSHKKRRKRDEVEAELAAHERAIAEHLAALAVADTADECPGEDEKARVRDALALLQRQALAERHALATSKAKTLVVAEPEAVIFGQLGSRQPSYNVQLVVDAATQLIISSEAVSTPTDTGQLLPTALRAAEMLGAEAHSLTLGHLTVVADAGYSSAKDAAALEQTGIDPVFPVTRTVNPHGGYFDRTAFVWQPEQDRMVCPAGKPMKPSPRIHDGAIEYHARKADCGVCALKACCTKAERRMVTRLVHEDALERVSQRLAADPGLMQQRRQSVEPVFGTLKRWLHGGRFLLKGRIEVNTELALVALAFNLKRMTNLHGTRRMLQATG